MSRFLKTFQVSLLLSVWMISSVYAADDLTARRKQYDCQKKAVEYAYNMNRAGDKEVIDKHFRACMGVSALNSSSDAKLCSDDSTHPIVFVNNSKEDIYVGIWQGSGRDGGGKRGFDAPSDFKDWKLPKGETKTWCAPKGFNGRVFPRTGCRDGKNCDVGNCCYPDQDTCKGYRCTTANQPASAVEFNDDDNRLNYDVSYVDGYNFPILMTPIKANGDAVTPAEKCQVAGCKTITPCVWSKKNIPMTGVCLAPYKLFEKQHSDFLKLQQYYILAAKCVDDSSCGCGNQCKLNPENNPQANRPACPNTGTVGGITILSAGCSTVAYEAGIYDRKGKEDPAAKQQTVCDPSSDNPDNCNPNLKWEALYQDYPRNVSCQNSYFWQYHDDSGNLSCLDSTAAKGFKIEFGPLAEGLSSGGVSFKIAPGFAKAGDPVSGSVTVISDKTSTYSFTGPTALDLNLKSNDQLVFKLECRKQSDMSKTGKTLTCLLTFDEKTGLSTTDEACKKAMDSGLNFISNTMLSLGATNEDFIKNDKFANQCK